MKEAMFYQHGQGNKAGKGSRILSEYLRCDNHIKVIANSIVFCFTHTDLALSIINKRFSVFPRRLSELSITG